MASYLGIFLLSCLMFCSLSSPSLSKEQQPRDKEKLSSLARLTCKCSFAFVVIGTGHSRTTVYWPNTRMHAHCTNTCTW